MTDLHYHFRQGCLLHIQEFYSQSLEVPGDLELTDIHKNHLHQHFFLFCSFHYVTDIKPYSIFKQ